MSLAGALVGSTVAASADTQSDYKAELERYEQAKKDYDKKMAQYQIDLAKYKED